MASTFEYDCLKAALGGRGPGSEPDALNPFDGIKVGVVVQDWKAVLFGERADPGVMRRYGGSLPLQLQANICITVGGRHGDGGNFHQR